MEAGDEAASEKTKCSLSDADTFKLVNNLNKDLDACLEDAKHGRKKCPEGDNEGATKKFQQAGMRAKKRQHHGIA